MSQDDAWMVTARLLRRSGFGTTGPEVDAAVGGGSTQLVRQILAGRTDGDAGARSTPAPQFAALPTRAKSESKEQKAARNKQLRDQTSTLTAWWLRRMVAVQHPFDEKLTFLWHNHFATSAQKVRSAPAMLAQNEKLRALGRGDFHTLAYAMLTDAAMLRWLDGEKNTEKAPNENLGREFMELFALGHGNGYTETDVREGARALTGWRINPDGSTSVRPAQHDAGSKTLLGVTGNLDAAGYCDAVLGAPGSARYVLTSMWSLLVSATPPGDATLARLLDAYGPDRNLTAALSAMLGSPEQSAARGSIVISPVEWAIGAVRTLRIPLTDDKSVQQLAGVLKLLGQLPFYPPSVGGWPAGQAWLSTAAADGRMQAAAGWARSGDITPVRAAAIGDRIDAAGYFLGIGAFSDRTTSVLRGLVNDPVTLVAVAMNTPEYLTN
ncbi:MAG: DUF1800 domain-containing protein [Mycobacteriaceae bacterium]